MRSCLDILAIFLSSNSAFRFSICSTDIDFIDSFVIAAVSIGFFNSGVAGALGVAADLVVVAGEADT
jgi:hypothetical protein